MASSPRLPLTPGHEIVGRVVGRGAGARRFADGARVGVGWLAHACGRCGHCRSGRENLPSFPYALLWGERCVRSVANLTRADGESLLRRAAAARVRSTVRPYALAAANAALDDLRHGRLDGAAVLVPGD